MTTRVICFGDSWGAGAELQIIQRPFVHWFAIGVKHHDKSTNHLNKKVTDSIAAHHHDQKYKNQIAKYLNQCLYIKLDKQKIELIS